MKKILLAFLLYFSLVASASGLQVVKLSLTGDLVDSKGTLAAGEMKRVSGATKINSGVLSTVRGNRTQLIEWSHEFDNAWWAKTNTTITTGIADPDGGTDACYMKADATATEARTLTVTNIMEPGQYYIVSIYGKKADIDFLRILQRKHSGAYIISYFNLSTGTWGTTGHTTKGFINEGDGWYRVWVMIYSDTGAANDAIYFGMTSTDNVYIYAGTLGEGIYVYGAQFEKLEGPSAPPGDELIDDINNRTFVAASDWTNTDITAYTEAGDLTITANAADQFCTLATAEAPMTSYQAYLLEFDVAAIQSTWTVSDFDAGYTIGTISANGTDQQILFSYADASSGGLRITSVANNSSMDFDNVSLKEITFPGPLEPGPYTATAGATATIPTEARFEDGWLKVESEEATNYALHSRDLSNAVWVKTNCTGTKDQIGLDEIASSASLLTASAANATCLQTVTRASTAKTFSVYIKRSVGTGTISMTDDDRANYTVCASLSSTAFTKYEITRTQANPVIGFKIATDTDAIIVDCNQLEETAYPTSPIPTTTSPVTRTADAGTAADNGGSWTITQALKNILDDAEPGGAPTDSQGTLLFEVKWGCDESVFTATSRGIISLRNHGSSIGYFNNANFLANDQSNTTQIAHPAFFAGDVIYYAVRWGDVDGNANDISVGFKEAEGTWGFGTPATYDGEFTLGTDLRLAFSNIYPFHIRNIRFYDEAFTQAEIAAGVDGGILLWMPLLEFP